MKKSTIISILMFAILLTSSCNAWLDVKPTNEKEREDQFSTVNGFRSALIGCYLNLKDKSLYGEAMTMTTIEYLAQLWESKSDNVKNFMNLDWSADYSKSQMLATFSKMYNTINQLNDILIQLDVQGEEAIPQDEIRNLVKGEALAMRAFCHFDILRLFGPSPKDPNKTSVSLPYSETCGYDLIPYYTYDTYVEKLWEDIDRADSLLQLVDPVQNFTFGDLNNPTMMLQNSQIISDFQAYRQVRFNYWAVKALKARMALYLGDKTVAYENAKFLIDARVKGKPIGDMASFSYDVGREWFTLPSETIFAVNCYDLITSIENIFQNRQNVLYKFPDQGTLIVELFENQSSDARLQLWTDMSYQTERHQGLCKYWQQDEEENTDAMIYGQQIPIFRMSEIYLIAAECAPSLEESNALMDVFRGDRALQPIVYADQSQLNAAILKEYLKEFYAEGQMFFTYKRIGATEMIWNETRKIEVSEYQIPLPEEEYTNK